MNTKLTKILIIGAVASALLLAGVFSYSPEADSFAAATAVGTRQGGTSTSTPPTEGQILIGNSIGTYSLNTLTAGSGVTITNATNSITIAAPGVFAWTPSSEGNSTSTRLILGNGFISQASSTISSTLSVSTLSSGLLGSGNGLLYGGIATGTVSGTNGITVTASRSAIGGALAIDCTVATGSAAGCLASADWTIFNNKAGFAYPFPSNATTSQLTLGGFISTASSTVAGDFRVTGVATSTNSAILGDINNTSNTSVNPYLRGSSGTLSISTAGNAGTILSVQGNYAYLVSNGNTDTFQAFDLSTSSPARIGQLTNVLGGNVSTALFVQGNYAYVVGNAAQLAIIDITKPDAPVRKSLNTLSAGNLTSIYVAGRYAYMVDASGTDLKLFIWNVSDPAVPYQVSSFANGGSSGSFGRRVFVTGKYAYLTTDNGRLRKIDVSNPSAPAETGFASTTGTNLTGIFVQDNYAYVSAYSGTAGIEIYDVSTSSPSKVGVLTGINSPIAVSVYGKYAYVVNESGTTRLRIVDVSEPTSPVVVGIVTANTSPQDVKVNGKYAYVVSSNSTLQTYQIPGLESTAANIYSLSGGDAQFRNNVFVGNQLNVGNSLSVGSGGIYIAGQLSVGLASSTESNPISGYFQGAVGIGTTTPGRTLGVTGTALITGAVTFSSTLSLGGQLTSSSTIDFGGATVVQRLYPAFSYATSTAWTGTTTIQLGPAYKAEQWTGVKCFTDVGTLRVGFNDGTNYMNPFQASTTVGTVLLNTNNAFTVNEKRFVDIGNPASSPTQISCSVEKTINQ